MAKLFSKNILFYFASMDLDKLFQSGYSREQAEEVVTWVGANATRFDELLKIFLTHSDYRIVQRAAWPLSDIAIDQPKLIEKHYRKIIKYMKAPSLPAAVRRNILRIFDHLPAIPEAYHGTLMEACFQYIADPGEAIATQAYSLGILEKLAECYPDILPELKTIVETRFAQASPAFRSRAKKILRKK